MARLVLLAGGGTGGHIAPLLAVREALEVLDPELACAYVGTKADLDSPLLKNSPLLLGAYAIPAGKIHRFLTWRQVGETWRMLQGFAAARRLIQDLKPAAVFCKGSMVSVPIAWAAARQGIPVFSHESDVIPGLANRIISRWAQTIFTAYPSSEYQKLSQSKLYYTGQPVRADFRKKSNDSITLQGRIVPEDRPIITVIGGSQGAHRINELVAGVWPEIIEKATLVHICGSRDLAVFTKKAASFAKGHLFVEAFIENELPALFQKSSLIISRAGGTIAELAAARKAAILLPLSTAAQNHQAANAAVLARAAAAEVFDEREMSSQKLWQTIQRLLDNAEERKMLEKNIAQFDCPTAALDMARAILKEVKKKHG